ncbi:uncharacterized protein ASCRUDRAFT_14141, partial [Ascoidea rubescens DSM 1968]
MSANSFYGSGSDKGQSNQQQQQQQQPIGEGQEGERGFLASVAGAGAGYYAGGKAKDSKLAKLGGALIGAYLAQAKPVADSTSISEEDEIYCLAEYVTYTEVVDCSCETCTTDYFEYTTAIDCDKLTDIFTDGELDYTFTGTSTNTDFLEAGSLSSSQTDSITSSSTSSTPTLSVSDSPASPGSGSTIPSESVSSSSDSTITSSSSSSSISESGSSASISESGSSVSISE